MKVPTSKLRDAFSVVDLVSQQNVMLSSQFVRLTAKGGSLKMSLTGLMHGESSVKFMDEEEWEFFADRKAVSAFLSSAKGQDVTLTHGPASLKFQSGRQKMELEAPKDAISGYSNWPVTEKLPIKAFASDVEFLGVFAATDPGSERLAAVKVIAKYGAIATDSVTMAAVLDKGIAVSVDIPTQVAGLIGKLKADTLMVGKSGVGMAAKDGRIYQPGSTQLKHYPEKRLRSVLDDTLKSKAVFSMKAKTLERLLAGLDQFGGGEVTVSNLQIRGTKLTVTTNFVGGEIVRSGELAAADSKLEQDLKWSIVKPLAWLHHVVELNADAFVLCCRLEGMSALVCVPRKDSQRAFLLVFSDM